MTHFQATCQALIAIAVESLANLPHLTEAQRKTRSEAVVQAIMAFLPAEPVQVMLASQAVGQHFSLMDAFQQLAAQAMAPEMAVKLRAVAVRQSRVAMALIREIRTVREEMHEAARAEAERKEAAMAATETVPSEPPAPQEPAQTAAPEPQVRTQDDPTFEADMRQFEQALPALWAMLSRNVEAGQPARPAA